MKLDKAQIIVLVVGIAILLGWDPVCKYMGWFQVPVAAPAPAAQTSQDRHFHLQGTPVTTSTVLHSRRNCIISLNRQKMVM